MVLGIFMKRSVFLCTSATFAYYLPMSRGKRTVFTASCPDCKGRVGTVRLHKQNSKGVGWKDFSATKFCSDCRKRVDVKLKEERHSK